MFKAERHWHELMQVLEVAAQKALKHWQVLEVQYMSDSRHYHTLQHIGHFLEALEQFDTSHDPALAIAAFYHDAVYDTRSKDNEAMSAQLAGEVLADMGLTDKFEKLVQTLILATHNHCAGDGPDRAKIELFLDCDLLILGSPQADYDRYSKDIRKEYSHYPDAAYRSGRAAVLRDFLNRVQIFKTAAIRNHYETQARQNIERELSLL